MREPTEVESGNSCVTSVQDQQSMNQLPWNLCSECCKTTDEHKEVYLLGCFHTICSDECLKKLKSQAKTQSAGEKYFCGICKLEVQLKDVEKRVAPSNIFVRKSDASNVKLKCNKCIRPIPLEVAAYCEDCPGCLCTKCLENHPFDVLTTSHARIHSNLESIKRKEFDILLQTELYCEVHQSNLKSFYCCTCSKKLCKYCKLTEDHDNHEVCNSQDEHSLLKSKAENARVLLEKCKIAERELDNKRKELNSEKDAVDKKIDDVTEWMMSCLKTRQKQLKENSEVLYREICKELQKKSEEVLIAKRKCHTLSKVVDEVNNWRDDVAAAIVLKHFEQFLSHFTELDTKIRTVFDDFVAKGKHFSFNWDGNCSITTGFKNVGKIEYTKCNSEEQIPVPINIMDSGGSAEQQTEYDNTMHTETSHTSRTDPSEPKRKRSRLQGSNPELVITQQSSEIDPQHRVEIEASINGNLQYETIYEGESLMEIASRYLSRTNINQDQPPLGTENESEPGPSSSITTQKKRGRPKKSNSDSVSISVPTKFKVGRLPTIIEKFKEGVSWTLEDLAKLPNKNNAEFLCALCVQPKCEALAFCNRCGMFFHLNCHAPALPVQPAREDGWVCSICKPNFEIEQTIEHLPNLNDSANWELDENSGRHFGKACKFLMECYLIPEMVILRSDFPERYLNSVPKSKVPFTLKYIHSRLVSSNPEPFIGVEEFMLAFHQMFLQVFLVYKKLERSKGLELAESRRCFTTFRKLVAEYYPEHYEIFKNIHELTSAYVKRHWKKRN